MAILSKIRDHSIFLIIIIALALFSFVIGDIFKKGNFGGDKNSVGEINGENIGRQEFAQLVEEQNARSGNRSSQLQSVNAAWDNLVRQKIYETQLEKSGVVVGEKDVWDEIVRQVAMQPNPQFMNEAGMFDEDKFKEYIANLKDNQDENEQTKLMWLSWLNYERNVKSNLEIRTYNNLINAGLGATLKEGEHFYNDSNTKLDLEYVYVPYTSISDSLVKVTDDEIKAYVKSHPDEYRTEPSVDVNFVKFDIKATPEDEEAIKNEVAGLINDKEEYSTAAKTTVTIKGLATTDNIEDFFREHSSDTPLDNNYHFKSTVDKAIADTLFKMKPGQVYGPYKEANYYKISRVMGFKQMPDSVKARHILIPFLGAMRADPSITRNEAEASKLADSLLTILKSDKSKFESFVKEYSSDVGSINNGGKYDWFPYNRMVPEFRDFTFDGKTGDMGVVKTDFGFHIIEIEGQKNFQEAVRLATFSREITASEETVNSIYQKAETFAQQASDGKDMAELAKEDGLTSQPVIGLKGMDERVSTLGNQRQIVTWAFEKDTKENDIKRFDVDNGYAVVQVTGKRKKGLSIGTSKAAIRALLANEKKTTIIGDKMTGSSLEDIAKAFDVKVESSKAVSIGSPVLPGVGRADELITSILGLPENKLLTKIPTKTGVFAVIVTHKETPQPMENYTGAAATITNNLKSKSGRSFEILKKLADIQDNRAAFY